LVYILGGIIFRWAHCFHQKTSRCEGMDFSVLPRNEELTETYFSVRMDPSHCLESVHISLFAACLILLQVQKHFQPFVHFFTDVRNKYTTYFLQTETPYIAVYVMLQQHMEQYKNVLIFKMVHTTTPSVFSHARTFTCCLLSICMLFCCPIFITQLELLQLPVFERVQQPQ
jgi:hypothetical protein